MWPLRSVCPYNAISSRKRPCEVACKVHAIHMDERKIAKIDEEKCTSCGACVYMCPFGAPVDKSFILDASACCARPRSTTGGRPFPSP